MKTRNEYTAQVTALSIKDLSAIYGVSRKVIRKWLLPIQKKIGHREGHYYNVAQVTIIFEHLGLPCVGAFILGCVYW